MTELSDFDQVVEQHHAALGEIIGGSAEGFKALYSHEDDVTLANPFGPPARGWTRVAETLDGAAGTYEAGELTSFEPLAKCVTRDLAYTVEMELLHAQRAPRGAPRRRGPHEPRARPGALRDFQDRRGGISGAPSASSTSAVAASWPEGWGTKRPGWCPPSSEASGLQATFSASQIDAYARRKEMQVSSSVKDLEEVVQQYHAALDAFVRGRPEPMKALFSHAADVVLANPFGPAVRGWDNASAALDYASSRFSDGEAAGFDRMATYLAPDLATIYEVEQGKISVGGGPVTSWLLRTTTTFRREDGTWRVVHRHADPISTVNSEGPLRTV